ncbi:uracil-DNA glycosylase family protein [Aequorivita vladivostokensis]|uniref:DNA glycosylase n=1 Tax=Aequorivita vladivostokensis TaxID=171194 RepID=A0ABR5DMS7_9FLAO|nr:uracil-DNA glycosylase family protein [Aequorivita vladivostokensis]KJJ40084.1 DNA glycosylase [Aequorivita vladivostokensis]MAB56066.1 DNA glycosylase [Aequorivita sp.]MBF31108.1 DNA glycosylase [Aequorivita sp.]
MFHHIHPYPPFIPENATKLIVGTLPPPRFTTGELKEGDVDFCYGSRDGQLWTILDKIFDLDLKYETTAQAIAQREHFLKKRGIGICDMVASAKREKIDASDIGMMDVELRDLVAILQQNPSIDTLLFTGGNSKNGPEYFFRRKLREYNISLKLVSNKVPRIHSFKLPESGRIIKTVSLIAPSGAANRAVGSLAEYKRMKAEFPEKTTIDFRADLYKPFF